MRLLFPFSPRIILAFFVFSVFGWICETIFCSVISKKWVPRGFLFGPYCPIYGFGAVSILILLLPLRNHPLLLFFGATLFCSLLEYFTSWLMEKIFHLRWWDYSKNRFNLNGRICLQNSLLFGLMGLFLVYIANPIFVKWTDSIPSSQQRVISSVLLAGMLVDFLLSTASVFQIRAKLLQVYHNLESIKAEHPHLLKESLEELLAHPEKEGELNEKIVTLRQQINDLHPKNTKVQTMIIDSDHKKYHQLGEAVSVSKLYLANQANARLDARRARKSAETVGKTSSPTPFASGVHFKKLFWIFVIASVLGYVAETLYCLATRGYLESRQGLVWGPFSQIYGLGAVLLTLVLQKATDPQNKNWSDFRIFTVTALVGGAFEAFCSFIQERLFGTVSWDYQKSSAISLFGGRTSLVYMLFWGFLGVFFIREIYPRLSHTIERIPQKQGRILTWILGVFLLVDLLVSIGAVSRWSLREQGAPPKNAVDTFFDLHFPDEEMKEIYPNMKMADHATIPYEKN